MGFITGLHPDYHTQYDRPEKINYVKMEKIARLVHQVSWDIANADARPKAPATPSSHVRSESRRRRVAEPQRRRTTATACSRGSSVDRVRAC